MKEEVVISGGCRGALVAQSYCWLHHLLGHLKGHAALPAARPEVLPLLEGL